MSKEPVREIDGVPAAMTGHFSRRSAATKRRYGDLLRGYREANGREPPVTVADKLAQQATLETRPGNRVVVAKPRPLRTCLP